MKHILCFGDSNTWGFIPGSGKRYDEHTRWTGVLADILGEGWYVHEEGLNARTTVFDSSFKDFLNGRKALTMLLQSQKPIDVLVISLGTNDLKEHNAWHSAMGIGQLVNDALHVDEVIPSSEPVWSNGPQILVVSPIAIGECLENINPLDDLAGKHVESLRFPELMGMICRQYDVEMVDAQQLAHPSDVDGVHMTAEGHRALGLHIAQKVKLMAYT